VIACEPSVGRDTHFEKHWFEGLTKLAEIIWWGVQGPGLTKTPTPGPVGPISDPVCGPCRC